MATVLAGVGLGVAAADDAAAVPTVNCPGVAGELPGAIPAQAQAEIARNLALLNTQIAEANRRLETSVGQGGPNFIQNAILGPLKDKRAATINRMATAIGRNAAKPVLDVQGLATCTLNTGGGGSATEPPAPPAGGGGAEEGDGGAEGGGAKGGGGVPTVNCPGVAGELPGAIPAQAQAEIARNLALLNTQIAEANRRLETSVGQGGPNFIQNAILGPLKDKRIATINRMATAIGRNAAKPVLDVQRLATCSLNEEGGGSATEPSAPPAGDGGAEEGDGGGAGKGDAAVPTVNCPGVAGALPTAIPPQAQAEINRNLALLNTQIAEANRRLETSVGQGGPNFIQNAILGPLKDKRAATINRMATAIGRNAAKPVLDVQGLATCSLKG